MFIIQLLVLIYLLVSSIALLIFAYKKFLQYLSPVKGYLASAIVIIGLLSFDFALYSFANDHIIQLKNQEAVTTNSFSGNLHNQGNM